ncbi:splicing factor U2af large subunit B [Quercus suber]
MSDYASIDNEERREPESEPGRSSPFDARHSHHKQNLRGSDRERLRVRERNRDRETDGDRHHRNYRDRSMRDDKGRGKYDDYDRHQSSHYDRHRSYGGDRERRHGHRSRSSSRDGSKNESRSDSRSRSRSKSKRTSGFDMAPSNADVLHGAAVPVQPPVVSQSMPGIVQNMLPFGTSQVHVFHKHHLLISSVGSAILNPLKKKKKTL